MEIRLTSNSHLNTHVYTHIHYMHTYQGSIFGLVKVKKQVTKASE